MIIMTALQILRQWLAFGVSCLFACSTWACAAPPPASLPAGNADTPPRLTVADFMGTWKVFAKSGREVIPSINMIYQKAIGGVVTFCKEKAVDGTGGVILDFPILKGQRKPVYVVEYKKMYPDTAHPNIPWIANSYPYSGGIVIFKVGYFSKIEKKIIYDDFYVGSNDKSFPFALTADLGDTSFYLCKLNPQTGKCYHMPPRMERRQGQRQAPGP